MDNISALNSESIERVSKDNVVNLTIDTISKGKQVLIFNNSKNSSEATSDRVAEAVKDSILDKKEKEILRELSDKILKSLPSPTKQCRRLSKAVLKGIAFHHSGVTAKQRTIIEKGFKDGYIKVISSTPTLAAGLNLPAYKVIVKDYKRYSSRGFNDIPVLEYHQMSGRAGRPGREDIGKAVLHIKSEDELERVIPKYVFGKPEEIISKLAVEPTLKMYMLSLISMDMTNTKDEIKDFFKNTLYAHQYKDLDTLYLNLFRILSALKEFDFVNQEDDYYMATPLGKKVSELYLGPDTAHYFLLNIEEFFKRFSREDLSKYDIYSLIHFVTNTIEMKPLFRVGKVEEETYVKKAEDVSDSLAIEFNPFEMDYADFMNSLKTTDVFMDWITEAPEDYICEKYKITPGELHYKIGIIDWLFYCLEEISVMKKSFYFKNYLNKMRLRFKFGIKEEIIPFVSLKGIGRVRARSLYKAGFKKIADLKKAEFAQISRVVGDKITIKIKEQLTNEADLKDESLAKPKEIKVREVLDEEVEQLVEAHTTFEKEKNEVNKNLDDYF